MIARLPLVALLCLAACKKSEAPDAAVAPSIMISDPTVLVEVTLPASWTAAFGADAGLSEGTIADARRPAKPGAPVLVAPRFVVMAEPLDRWLELDSLLDRTMLGIKRIETSGAAKIQRSSKGRRTLDGVELGELRVDYRVIDPTGKADRDVVQRNWLVQRFGTDGKTYVLTMTLTHLLSDEEVVGREVEDVLRSVRFLQETR